MVVLIMCEESEESEIVDDLLDEGDDLPIVEVKGISLSPLTSICGHSECSTSVNKN